MGHQCCVPNCSSNSRSSRNGTLTFHAFPVDPRERRLWILNVKRADYKKLTISKHTKVCSKHFKEEDFIPNDGSKRRMLRKGVVPSIFTWTDEDQILPRNPVIKTEPSTSELGGNFSNESTQTEPASDSVSKELVKERAEDMKAKSVEKKPKDKNIKKEMECSIEDLVMNASSCGSPDGSEQGSISDMNVTNGSSPSSSNDTSQRKQATLVFQIGTRLEAKDLGNEIWYPVKVVEVDWEDEEVLIHFEKWSQRYDEWVPMDSPRLRPTQNPTPQSDGKSASKVFRVGDCVMAKWSDCRRYPAKVKTVLGNDKYEVHFFDGFTKVIKGIRMTKLEGEPDTKDGLGPGASEKLLPPPPKPVVRNTITEGAIGTKEERRERKRKLNVAELFHPKKRVKLEPESSSFDTDKGKKVEKGKKRKDVEQNEGDILEGEKSSDTVKTNESVEIPVQAPEIPVHVAAEDIKENKDIKVDEDAADKQKKKTSSKSSGGTGEIAAKPRRGLRRGESHTKTKFIEIKSTSRKAPRKIPPEVQESPPAPPEDSSKGSTEDNETSKIKKELPDETPMPELKPEVNESDNTKKIPGSMEGYTVETADGPRKTLIVPDKNLPPGWSKHTIQRKHGNSAGKWDVLLVNPQGRRFRSRYELQRYFEEEGQPFKEDLFDFCLRGKKRGPRISSSTRKASKRRGLKTNRSRGLGKDSSSIGPGGDGLDQQTSSYFPPPQPPQEVQPPPIQRRVRTLLPKIRRPSGSQSSEDNADKLTGPPSPPPPPYTTTVAPVPVVKVEEEMHEGEVLVGGLKIQMENNTYKCPKERCGKNFRKENLLQMHLKHYHPEYNKFMGSTPNVADLAYARTIGESIDDLMPKPRYSIGSPSVVSSTPYIEKTSRFDSPRKSKGGVPVGVSGAKGGIGGGGDASPVPEKKKVATKEKPPVTFGVKRPKGIIVDNESRVSAEENVVENQVPTEENLSLPDKREGTSTPVADITPTIPVKEEKKEPQTTIKTLLPVIRSPSHAQEAERAKPKLPSAEEGEEYVEVIDIGPRQAQPSPSTSHVQTPQPTGASSQPPTSVTKSLRTVKRRRLSDFHFEPIHKRRKIASKLEVSEDVDVVDDRGSPVDVVATSAGGATPGGPTASGKSTPTTYRYSRKKTPVVHLEKLNVTTDSNGRVLLSSIKDKAVRKLLATPAEPSLEQLRKEELINCTCGFMEEDGLMIQCDLCLCWQHGICNNIEKETEVPEKYVCPICLNPYRQRKSKKYLHDQDWLKEGKLPSLSFRSKNEANIQERETILKRSHDLTGSLLQIQQVLHSLRVKVNIAGKPDHPKLYLWAKSWEKEGESSTTTQQPSTSQQTSMESVSELKSQLEASVPSCSRSQIKAEPPADIVPMSSTLDQKDVVSDTEVSGRGDEEAGQNESTDTATEIESLLGEAESEINQRDLIEKEIEDDLTHSDDLSQQTKRDVPQLNAEEILVKEEVVQSDMTVDAIKAEETIAMPASETAGTSIETSESIEGESSEPKPAEETTDQNPSKSTETKPEPEIQSEILQDLEVTNIQEVEVSTEPTSELKPPDASDNAEHLGSMSEHTNEINIIESAVIDDNIQAEVEVTDSDAPLTSKVGMNESENTVKSESDMKPLGTEENHGLLHQALTNGSHSANPLSNGSLGNQIDASSMLQLPICQSELIRFASTMADNLRETEPSRPAPLIPEPVPQAPKAPQPEAPIDPVECRLLLLDHIDHFQQQIDTRLTMLEEQVAALESQDPDAAKDEAPDHYPQTKQTIQMLLRDLLTMRKIAGLN